MKNILYLQSAPKSLTRSARKFLTKRPYQALFFDEPGERRKLGDCLECLEAGDTLFLFREDHLADDVMGYVRILMQLTGKGVRVWVERIKRMFSSEYFHFLESTGVEEAKTFVQVFNLYFLHKMGDLGVKGGKKVRQLHSLFPEDFETARLDWYAGRATGIDAATRCRIALSTFRKLARNQLDKSVNHGCAVAG